MKTFSLRVWYPDSWYIIKNSSTKNENLQFLKKIIPIIYTDLFMSNLTSVYIKSQFYTKYSVICNWIKNIYKTICTTCVWIE